MSHNAIATPSALQDELYIFGHRLKLVLQKGIRLENTVAIMRTQLNHEIQEFENRMLTIIPTHEHRLLISKRTYLDKARNHVDTAMKLLSLYAVEGVFKSLNYQDIVSAIGKLRMAEWELGEAENCVEEDPDEERTLGYRDDYDEWYERLDRLKESETS